MSPRSKRNQSPLPRLSFSSAAALWILLLLAALSLIAVGCDTSAAEQDQPLPLGLEGEEEKEKEAELPSVSEAEWLASTAGQYQISAYLTAAPASYHVETVTHSNPSQTAVYQYPQIREMEDAEVMERINAVLFNSYYVEEIDWHDLEQNPNIDFSIDPPGSLSGEVEIALHRQISSVATLMNEAFLCVVTTDYLEGSVSYVVTVSSQLFDLSSGNQIYFSDLAAFSEEMFDILLSTEEAQNYAEQHEAWWYGASDWSYGSAPDYLDESTHFYPEHFTVCFPSYLNYEDIPGYRLVEYPYSMLEAFWLPVAEQ